MSAQLRPYYIDKCAQREGDPARTSLIVTHLTKLLKGLSSQKQKKKKRREEIVLMQMGRQKVVPGVNNWDCGRGAATGRRLRLSHQAKEKKIKLKSVMYVKRRYHKLLIYAYYILFKSRLNWGNVPNLQIIKEEAGGWVIFSLYNTNGTIINFVIIVVLLKYQLII